MNKNDFYKELMTQYALDPEKIRMNALKQAKKPAWQRAVGDYWKPAMGAAAAVAVTVAGVTYANRSSVPDIVVDQNDVLSASQRLIEAEMDYYNTEKNEETTDVYVTFMEPVSYNELIMAFSAVADSGEFKLCSVYLDDSPVDGVALDALIAGSADEETVIAAKVSLPLSCYRDVQDLSIVYLAELASEEINDDTFEPIPVEDDDPLESDYMSITTTVTEKPVVTTTPFSFEATSTTPEEIPVIGESDNQNGMTTVPPETTSEVELEEPDETTEETTEVTTVPVETTTPEETTTTYFRGEVGLMTEIYELNVKNSLETHISGDNVVVLAKNEAYFYTIGGFTAAPYGETIAISNPKLAYKDDSVVLLTGCREDGVRCMISVVNLIENTVYTYDASANIGDCEIGDIRYSEAADKYFMKAVSADSTLVYELTIDNAVYFRPLAEIEAPVSLAGYKNNLLYFTICESSTSTRLYSFSCVDGTSVEIAQFGSVKLRRGSDFESFGVYADEGMTYIYDVNIGMLVSAALDESTRLITNGTETFFSVGDVTYKIDSSSAVYQADRAVAFERITNEEFIVNEINSEKVVVIRKDDSIWQ